MKTKLPKSSQVAKDKLDRIVQAILDVTENKVAMIILFGSYARGDWFRILMLKIILHIAMKVT